MIKIKLSLFNISSKLNSAVYYLKREEEEEGIEQQEKKNKF